jgi:hypothetical protein
MNKTAILFIGLALVVLMTGSVSARNDKYILPIGQALQSADALAKPDGSVKFFFGKQESPEILARLGNGETHQRSTTRRPEDERACNVAFLEALVALQNRAPQLRANAVVSIVSYYKKDVTSSATEFECHAGVSAHVMLRGEFVKIADD